MHGLFGHAKNTWTSITAFHDKRAQAQNSYRSSGPPERKKLRKEPKELFEQTFWPRDLLPRKIPCARIITWGYDVQIASLISGAATSSIYQHSDTLLADLVSLRNSTKTKKEKPLIFVAHSLGGIIVKDALSLSRQETTSCREILPATIGVVFLGTPHQGSKAASLGKMAFELTRCFLKDPDLRILRALERDSEILERISRSFGYVLAAGHIKVHSFREELGTHGITIVDASSSMVNYLHESRSNLHANHRDMAKFSSAKDPNFERVQGILQLWIDDIDSTRSATSTPTTGLNIAEAPDSIVFDGAYQRCLQTLDVPETRIRVENVELAYADTYTWLYDDNLGFKSWLEGTNQDPMFWISGKPGSGKSTLMKYAMTNTKTKKYLRNCTKSSWLVTGYFFHDRGTEMQKSIQGFLCEILYQILRARPVLFAIIQSEHARFMQVDAKTKQNQWSISRLRQALLHIGEKSTSDFNCCLFVDALDEQEGKHRDLVLILKELAQLSKSSVFRLRLCLAGRPENIFVGAFDTLPGFAIQDYTGGDIRHYAEDRIQRENFGILDDQSSQDAQRLVNVVEQRAEGVFLWVRLVVNEMIEGLCDGYTFEELLLVLSEMPTELSDLYTRAVRRVRRGASASAQVNERLETYTMFQIAICAKEPIPLAIFINIVRYNLPWSRPDDASEMSDDRMTRRLNSRSAGLLEPDERNRRGDVHVQFVHQTVKEFITSKQGKEVIKKDVERPDDPRSYEEGSLFIVRYISSSFSRYPSPRAPKSWSFKNFIEYANDLEGHGTPVYWEMKADWWQFDRPQIEELFRSTNRKDASNWLRKAEHLSSAWTMFYVLCDLPLSLAACLRESNLHAEVSDLLFEAALSRENVSNYDCFQTLLNAGLGRSLSKQALSRLDNKVRELFVKANSTNTCELLNMWEEAHQADCGYMGK